jgi:hypothetical protein
MSPLFGVLYGNLVLHTHITNIAVFAHQDHRMEVATGQFAEMAARMDTAKLETLLSFLKIKSSMGLHRKILQVKHEIWQNRRETVHVQLEAIAKADNLHSLLQVLR